MAECWSTEHRCYGRSLFTKGDSRRSSYHTLQRQVAGVGMLRSRFEDRRLLKLAGYSAVCPKETVKVQSVLKMTTIPHYMPIALR